MSLAAKFLAEYETEMASTRKLLAAVPDAQFAWKPHTKSMTLGRLASHVAELSHWAEAALTTDALNLTPEMRPLDAATQAELLATFDKHVAAARAAIAATSDEQFEATWTLTFMGRPVFALPRAEVLRKVVLNHGYHHRGQLSVYLRLLDVAVPGMYGPSADDPKPF